MKKEVYLAMIQCEPRHYTTWEVCKTYRNACDWLMRQLGPDHHVVIVKKEVPLKEYLRDRLENKCRDFNLPLKKQLTCRQISIKRIELDL